jgi:AhpD family alkylhydroperoxidase
LEYVSATDRRRGRRPRQAQFRYRQGYTTLSRAGQKAGHLDEKTRELIALAVAITLRCDGCVTVHAAAARHRGATKEEIAEVLGVAVSVNAGAAVVYSTRALDAFDAAVELNPNA